MRTGKRSGVPSIDRGPSPRNALSDVRLRSSRAPRLGRRVARSRRLCTLRGSFGDPARAGPPSTSSRCQQGLRFSRPRSSLADFCNRFDVRAHPSSCRSSHASGAFAPLLAWHQPMPGCVGLSGALPHRGPASRDPLTPAFTPTCSACADEANHGPRRSSKGMVRALF
jgi:hypothetical protein